MSRTSHHDSLVSRANSFSAQAESRKCCFLEKLSFSAGLPCGRHYFPHIKWLPKITDYRDTAALRLCVLCSARGSQDDKLLKSNRNSFLSGPFHLIKLLSFSIRQMWTDSWIRRKKTRAALCFFRLIQLSLHICRIEKERSLIRWNGPDRNEFRFEQL